MLVLVSYHLTSSNYNTWSRAILMTLTTKNKIRFVNGSILHPTANDLLIRVWTCCNSVVISWILNAIARQIVDRLLYIDNAFEIWSNLHDHFHQSNGSQFFQIKKHLVALHQGSLDVNTYYTQLNIL